MVSVTDMAIEFIKDNYGGMFDFSPLSNLLFSDMLGRDISTDEVDDVKKRMFQRQDGTFIVIELIMSPSTIHNISEVAKDYLKEYKCFEVSILYDKFLNSINSQLIRDENDFEHFLEEHILTDCKFVNSFDKRFCKQKSNRISQLLNDIANKIQDYVLTNSTSTIFLEDIVKLYPNLTEETIKIIIGEFCHSLTRSNYEDKTQYVPNDNLNLPEDFAETLQAVINKIEDAGLSVTYETLKIAISLELSCNFEKEYNIPDIDVFKTIISRYYRGTSSRKWYHNRFVEVDSDVCI